ncbi:MAG: hypothetical protein H0V17_13660 [Deltaproteobacteria bacterium]|nr:hypothetical protein [Deltaproteobacteria bacterium]
MLVVDNGVERGMRCASTVRDAAIVDLRDAWTPRLFASRDGKAPDFRATYLAIASERDVAGKPLAPNDALSELYGIVPSLAIVRARFAEQTRHRCHAAIDSAPIAKLTRPLGQEHDGLVRSMEQSRRVLGPQLERARVERQLPDVAALATDRELGQMYARWKAADEQHAGIVAAQQHLVCEGYLGAKDVDGMMSWATGHALELYQRRNFLMPNYRLDPETRTALATDPRELDFRFALRVLRERIVDATGLIEDGTAGDGPTQILGRWLDPEQMRAARGHEKPLANAAPDLISIATETAARELGWTKPADAAAFLARHPGGIQVAVTLPKAPAYHAKHMQLTAVIDRGDVFYDNTPVPRVVQHRPSMTLYVDDHGTKRPLVRWPTTIGGWSDVLLGGAVVQRWKESDVGPRVWRDLFAAPTWLPPTSTPDRDLVKWVGAGKWDLKRSIIGPGSHAAFGMMLLPHYLPLKNGQIYDNGIGTHGSATVMSIQNGTSHGCHRLYNQLAVRLGAFLLSHRTHVVKGQKPEFFRRVVRFMGTYPIKIDTRGFLYELTPPVQIEVTRGRVLSSRQHPPAASAPARP